MEFKELMETDAAYIAGTYARYPVEVYDGSGAVCRDGGGRELIDFSSGIGVNSLGYTNPAWVNAVKEQIDRLAHMSNLYYTWPMAALARTLCQRTGFSRAFFCNSGAEANEGALKTARKYMSDNYPGKRDTVLTLKNSFHGRTIATLAATGQDSFHKNFGPFPEGFAYTAANDTGSLAASVTARVGAIFIECVQGEGGVVPLEQGFVDAVAEICRREDILLMVDEVQTGVGRTGKFLCLEHYGLSPDIVTLAKGLGGGLPIGAVLFGEKTSNTLGRGDHGTTFGGNPVCCAGASAVLEAMDDGFLVDITHKGEYMREKLRKLPGVISVSGKGMMLGAELESGISNTDIITSCIEKGLILLAAKHKLRFLPPLTITAEEIDKGLAILEDVLKIYTKN